ncbi:hypothetical protein PV04_01550 [Phialophora macrospora]|uniref:Methyltransferase type 11 domain-containing protein n=1 Tax=Phialophora macrospora TaxID=1851006 RepID=A0A0D2GM07_9EURO|nr:hypothetical protein PV04_01550 [Phialophora macrospora]
MSYRKPMYDTQQGASRTRDATVPRTVPTSSNNGRQLNTIRANASTRLASRSPPLVRDDFPGLPDRVGQKSTAIPRPSTRNLSQRSINTSKNAPIPSGMSRSTSRPESTSQEVPLVMDFYHGPSGREQTSGDRSFARNLGPSDYEQSSLDFSRDAIFGVAMPRANPTARAELPPRLIPELQALAAASTRLPQASNKSMSSGSSPSTQFSGSPSPWSVSTTTTTPTSWSSASPGIVQHVPLKTPTKRSQTVPLPAGKRDKIPKVPALPESLPPSVQGAWQAGSKESTKSSVRKKPLLHTPAPTPPPRTSSAKHSLSRSSSRSDRQRKTPTQEPTPSSSEVERSPLAGRGRTDLGTVGDSLQHGTVAQAHDNLQQSLGTGLSGTSRRDARAVAVKKIPTVDTDRAGPTPRVLPTPYSENRSLRRPNEALQRQERYNVAETLPGAPQAPEAQVQSSPGRTGKFSRLGLFGRRTKSPSTEVERSPRKLQRKGPAAGTGHEGYGRYGKRGRKMSQDDSSARGSESERSASSTRRIPLFSSKTKESRSSSRHNRSSQSDLDDFAATRLKPVPMIGGSGNNMKSESGSQLDIYSTSAPPGHVFDRWESPSQSKTSLSQQSLQDTQAITRDPTASMASGPTLALRRSQRFGNDAESFNLPTPIRTEGLSAPSYINSQDESRSSAFPTSTPSTIPDPSRGDIGFQKPKEKKSRKLRWNIFRRKGTDAEPERPVGLPSSSPEEMPVSVSAIPMARPMPYYAMIDSESEVNPPEAVGDYLAQVVDSPAVSPLAGGFDVDLTEDEPQPDLYEDNIFLPSAPVSPQQSFTRSPPSVPLQNPIEQPPLPTEQPTQRPPRLVRVGRIPPIVPRTEREHKPSRASFSQPFVRAPASEDFHVVPRLDVAPLMPLRVSTDVEPSRRLASPDSDQAANATSLGEAEFLRFPSRQASEVSTSSGSAGVSSILGPPLVPGLPGGGLPERSALQSSDYFPGSPSNDEVWNEYDDFIDHVMSPSRARKSIRAMAQDSPSLDRSGLEIRQMTQDHILRAQPSDPILSEFPIPTMKRPLYVGAPATSVTPPVVFPPPTMPERVVGDDIRLRRSRIASALHSSMDLSSPLSIRGPWNEHGNQSRSSAKFSERLSTSSAGRSLERLTTNTSAPDLPSEPSHQENVAMLEVVERSKDPVAQNELQYASLMVAKWLSFGRVLFSPAHDEIQAIPERHVLVIDGLGNEDWSIYCAVTYEAQRALVHNLKEKTHAQGVRMSHPSQHAPDNHRRAEVASFHERFPFPPGFFSVIVLRFPPAMAESKMKNIIAECRRVLLPGGYLELMLLDLDIVNMGVQTRRAVRELKFRMTTADKQISLRPIIDNFQSVLGSRGFTNISRCVVGVPVAGRPTGSADSSSSSRSSRGSDGSAQRRSGDGRASDASPRMTFSQGRRGTNLSLNELLSDRSDNADLRIGKIVSTTARTWWQHCFEASVISDGNLAKSIFADKKVLSECKGRGSSFKMLIAYAQRPVLDTRRRTMSEPVVPTLATAGGKRQTPSTGNPRTA